MFFSSSSLSNKSLARLSTEQVHDICPNVNHILIDIFDHHDELDALIKQKEK